METLLKYVYLLFAPIVFPIGLVRGLLKEGNKDFVIFLFLVSVVNLVIIIALNHR